MEISPKAIAEAFEAIHSTIQQTGTWKDDTWECLVDTTIKKDVVKAWRQLDAASGLYKFRVYGVLSQIQLDRFVEFYSDYEYRSTWDPYTASLEVVESTVTDTVTRHALLWRVKFGVPLVSDREYLFTRVSEKQGDVWVMVDQQWASPQFPEKKSVVRPSHANPLCLLALSGSAGNKSRLTLDVTSRCADTCCRIQLWNLSQTRDQRC